MDSLRFASDLRIGCIRLQGADLLPLVEAYVSVSAAQVALRLTGDMPKPWNLGTMVCIHTFRFPKGKSEFQRLVEWYGKERKTRARLPDGVQYDEHTLEVPNAPEGWTHDAWARSGRDFIHTYQSQKQALLLRLKGKDGTILDNPMLVQIHENLRIVEDQWIAKFPVTEPRQPDGQQVSDSPLPADVAMEVQQCAARAREMLGLDRKRNPRKTVEAIHQALEEVRGRKRMPAEEKKQRAIEFGALWGEALCAGAGWEWCRLGRTADEESYAVASKARPHAVDPIVLMHDIVSSRRRANNALLLFNMIVAKDLPESAPRAFSWLE